MEWADVSRRQEKYSNRQNVKLIVSLVLFNVWVGVGLHDNDYSSHNKIAIV